MQEQDPAIFGKEFAMKARDVLRTRYNLLPYLYNLFHDAHKTGAPVVRPLFFEFVNDRQTWTIDEQFMWGPALLISPLLRKVRAQISLIFEREELEIFAL